MIQNRRAYQLIHCHTRSRLLAGAAAVCGAACGHADLGLYHLLHRGGAPLPDSTQADPIDIPDDDFGIWYMDCQDEPQKYTGKTVRFLAQVCQTNRAGKNSFVPGRFAMTCCVQDIQFVGFPCSYDGYKALEQRAWVRVTAKVGYKFHNIYRGKGPVLTAVSVEPAEKPLEEVVTFS